MTSDESEGPGRPRIPNLPADDGDKWMARFTTLGDAELDELLMGRTPLGLEDLAPIAQFAVAVRERSSVHPTPAMSAALRAQVERQPSVPPRHVVAAWRRLLRASAVAVALGAVAAAAVQNVLPAPVQRIVSNAGDIVGIDVPRPEDDAEGEGQPADPSDVGPGAEDEPGASDEPGEPGGPDDATPGGTSDPRTTDTGGGGPPEETPGGATPADPGILGDGEPATPATAPAQSNGGGNGPGTRRWPGTGRWTGPGPGTRQWQGEQRFGLARPIAPVRSVGNSTPARISAARCGDTRGGGARWAEAPAAVPCSGTPERPTASGVCNNGTMQPGRFASGCDLGGGNGTTQMLPGVYWFQGTFDPRNYDLRCATCSAANGGVLMFFEAGSLSHTGNGTIQVLAYQTSQTVGDTYAGLSIYQARGNTTTMTVGGTAGSGMGSIYAHDARINLHGNVTRVILGLIVGDTIDFQGTTTTQVTPPPDGPKTEPILDVGLEA